MTELFYGARVDGKRADSEYTLSPIEMEIKQVLTSEPWRAYVTFTKDDGDSIHLGDTITCYLAASTIPTLTYLKQFTGIVEKKTNRYPKDKKTPVTEIEAISEGARFMVVNAVEKEIPIGQASMQIYAAVKDLISDGILAGIDCFYTSPDLPAITGTIGSYWDIVSGICKKVDWDFYVDQGNTLHAFPRGIHVNSLVVDANDYVMEMELEEDISNLITYQKVVGGEFRTIPVSINLTNWTGPIGAIISTLTLDDRNCICSHFTGTINYLEYNFRNTVDLYYSCNLNFGLEFYSNFMNIRPVEIQVKFKTDDSNFFFKTLKISGGHLMHDVFIRGDKFDGGFYIKPWVDQQYKLWIDPTWSIYGEPEWSKITKFAIQVNNPTTLTTKLYLSSLNITGLVYGIYQTLSPYGIRKGRLIYDENYTSEEMCTIAASLIVSSWCEPLRSAGEVPTAYNFDYNLGDRATLTLLDNTISYEVRQIRHVYSDGRLKTYLTLATKYRPEPGEILDFFKKQLEAVGGDLQRWKRLATDTGLIDTRTGLIEWGEASHLFPFSNWSEILHTQIIGESTDGYYITNNGGGTWDISTGHIQINGGASVETGISWFVPRVKDIPIDGRTIMFKTRFQVLNDSISTWDKFYFGVLREFISGGTVSFSGFCFYINVNSGSLAAMCKLGNWATFKTDLCSITPGSIYLCECQFYGLDKIIYYFVNNQCLATISYGDWYFADSFGVFGAIYQSQGGYNTIVLQYPVIGISW